MEQRISYQELTPETLAGLNRVEGFIKSSGLDLKLLELIKYRVSQINGCAFCLDMHYKEAISLGETALRLYSVSAWKECPYYTDNERAVLAFVELLLNSNHSEVSDEVYKGLRSHYTKQEIAVLTLAISSINTWNWINKTFQTLPGLYEVGQFA